MSGRSCPPARRDEQHHHQPREERTSSRSRSISLISSRRSFTPATSSRCIARNIPTRRSVRMASALKHQPVSAGSRAGATRHARLRLGERQCGKGLDPMDSIHRFVTLWFEAGAGSRAKKPIPPTARNSAMLVMPSATFCRSSSREKARRVRAGGGAACVRRRARG